MPNVRFLDEFEANIAEVKRLLDIHTTLGGAGPGRRRNLEILHKSSIVVLVACWEAFVEDLAEAAFDFLLRKARSHSAIPFNVLTSASKPLTDDNDGRRVWNIAGDGWKQVLKDYRSDLMDKHIGKLNTPRPDQVDSLFKKLLGLPSLSSNWHWAGMAAASAAVKLDRLVTLRGSIAHRVSTTHPVGRQHVEDNLDFVYRLAAKSTNAVRSHLKVQTGLFPWGPCRFRSVR